MNRKRKFILQPQAVEFLFGTDITVDGNSVIAIFINDCVLNQINKF